MRRQRAGEGRLHVSVCRHCVCMSMCVCVQVVVMCRLVGRPEGAVKRIARRDGLVPACLAACLPHSLRSLCFGVLCVVGMLLSFCHRVSVCLSDRGD